MTGAQSTRGAGHWLGWAMSGLAIAFLVMDAAMKLPPLPIVTDTMAGLGWDGGAGEARTLGVILLACTLLYAAPPTALLGAILLTAYLGGAVATHLRVGSPLFSHVLFGVYLALLVWSGLYLRNLRIRALLVSGP
jgi:hypothetical protein